MYICNCGEEFDSPMERTLHITECKYFKKMIELGTKLLDGIPKDKYGGHMIDDVWLGPIMIKAKELLDGEQDFFKECSVKFYKTISKDSGFKV